MSAPIRLLLVDDSSVVRKLLSQALSQHPEVEVAGTAANGIIALNKIAQLSPDLVVLDVEMPEMDGITMLGHLRKEYPRLPVIMFSTLTERGASTTFDALAAGASDYVLKPSTSQGETLEQVVASSLLPKIVGLTRSRFGAAMAAAIAAAGVEGAPSSPSRLLRGSTPTSGMFSAPPAHSVPFKPSMPGPLSRVPQATLSPSTSRGPLLPLNARPDKEAGLLGKGPFPDVPTTKTTLLAPGSSARASGSLRPSLRESARKPIQIIAIAASTGGPNALAEVLPRLPASLPVPVVIVQHMPPIFTRCLAERLSLRSELTIHESQGGERLSPGHVYIAPGNHHLELQREGDHVVTQLSDGPPENSCRPAADVLFRSVARSYGAGALCVVLTGMGQDGLRGAREVHEAGGRVLVQSGATCVIWGMPKVVEEAGLSEAAVPLPEIAAAILQRVGSGLLSPRTPGKER